MTAVELEPLPDQANLVAAPPVFAIAGTIETTVDPGRPVVNQLRLSIGVPPALPGGDAAGPVTGIFYLTFPWGDGPAALCSELEAQAITVTPDVDAAGWSVVRNSAPGTGYYWVLTPPPGGGPAAGGSCGFLIANIVSASAADLPPTLCFASCWHGSIDQSGAPSFWRTVPLAITALECSPAAPTPESPARLRWATTGAGRCRLEPGDDGDLPPSGELTLELGGPRELRLTALGANSRRTVSRTLRVAPPAGWVRLTRDEVVSDDGPILLATASEVLCLQPQDGFLRASRDGRTWTRRPLALPDRVLGAAGCAWASGLALTGGLPERTFDASASFVLQSRDGRSWTALTSSAWAQRTGHATIGFAGRLWAIGGVDTATGAASADVLSSADGVTWTASPAPPWAPRSRPALVVHDDALWLSGGLTSGTAGANAFTDLWRLVIDPWNPAPVWSQGLAPPWSGTRAVTSLAAAGGRLYALIVPLGEQPAQLWRLGARLTWEPAGAAPPIRTNRLLGLRVAMSAFHGGLLVVSDAGAWWYGVST